jgi:hypothetical protein
MSGSSANAAARRRRAGTDQPGPSGMVGNVIQQENTSDIDIDTDTRSKYTPLQLLKVHEAKFKNLEDTLEEKIAEIVNDVVNEKFALVTEGAPSNKSEPNNNDINLTNKIDELIRNLDDLKMLVIKNQTLGLETSNELIKIKDNLKELESELTSVKSNAMNNSENASDNITEMLFKNMLASSFSENEEQISKLNIHDGDDSNISNEELNDIGIPEIVVDSIGGPDIKLTPDDIQHIKDEIVEELNENNKITTETIEVSDEESNDDSTN